MNIRAKKALLIANRRQFDECELSQGARPEAGRGAPGARGSPNFFRERAIGPNVAACKIAMKEKGPRFYDETISVAIDAAWTTPVLPIRTPVRG